MKYLALFSVVVFCGCLSEAYAQEQWLEMGEGKKISLFRLDENNRFVVTNQTLKADRYPILHQQNVQISSSKSHLYLNILWNGKEQYWVRFDNLVMKIVERETFCSESTLDLAEKKVLSLAGPWLIHYEQDIQNKAQSKPIRRFKPDIQVKISCNPQNNLIIEFTLIGAILGADLSTSNAMPLMNTDQFLIKEIMLETFEALLVPPKEGLWETVALIQVHIYKDQDYVGVIELTKGAYFNLSGNRRMADFWSRVYNQAKAYWAKDKRE